MQIFPADGELESPAVAGLSLLPGLDSNQQPSVDSRIRGGHVVDAPAIRVGSQAMLVSAVVSSQTDSDRLHSLS
jgi:hypothetical protein